MLLLLLVVCSNHSGSLSHCIYLLHAMDQFECRFSHWCAVLPPSHRWLVVVVVKCQKQNAVVKSVTVASVNLYKCELIVMLKNSFDFLLRRILHISQSFSFSFLFSGIFFGFGYVWPVDS